VNSLQCLDYGSRLIFGTRNLPNCSLGSGFNLFAGILYDPIQLHANMVVAIASILSMDFASVAPFPSTGIGTEISFFW
jgi:hypothetical protein